MLLISIIGALIVAVLAVVFAFQNVNVILVNFLTWKFEGSMALALLLAFMMGVIASLLILLPRIIKNGLMVSEQNKKIKELEKRSEERINNSI